MTDRVPGTTAGNEFRVSNAIEGLLNVGDLHVLLVDSSAVGAPFRPDSRFERSTVRAAELPRWLRIAEAIWTIPHLRYGHEQALCLKVANSVELTGWDLVWFSRARVHRLCSSMFDGTHILDLDDLNDRLLTTLTHDRRRRLGIVRSFPRGAVDLLNAWRWRRRYRAIESRVARMAVCHDGDLQHLGASNGIVIPNGYPDLGARPSPLPGGNAMLFVGPMSYEPNYLAVRWFVDNVLDRVRAVVPNATLSVVGALSDPMQSIDHPAVELHGWVPDVTPYYNQAAITVAPLHSGGGTRIKIIEAMARNRPMVATTFAIEGLGLGTNSGILVADHPQQFAEHCIRLLTDAPVAAEQAEQAYATFTEHHHAGPAISAVVAAAEAVLEECSASKVRSLGGW